MHNYDVDLPPEQEAAVDKQLAQKIREDEERAATKIKKELQRRLQRLEKELADAAEAESQPYTWRRWMSWWINRAIMTVSLSLLYYVYCVIFDHIWDQVLGLQLSQPWESFALLAASLCWGALTFWLHVRVLGDVVSKLLI